MLRSEHHRHRPVDLPGSARATIETVAAHPDVRAIIVFGSRASGDHDARSDIDVAIEAPALDGAALARIRDRIAQFPTLYRISVTRLDTMPDILKERVLAQGITIYERAARKLDDSQGNLGRAISNLERALTIPTDGELVFEGTIHRFEITIELLWKTLKRVLEFEGLSPKTPRDSVKEAFRIGWLHDEAVWLDMLDHRNTTSHTYLSDELVAANYRDVAKVAPIIRTTFDFLAQRYGKA